MEGISNRQILGFGKGGEERKQRFQSLISVQDPRVFFTLEQLSSWKIFQEC